MSQVDLGDATGWEAMLASVRSHRNRDARHLKPVCLYVVSQGIDDGELDPDDIDAGLAIEGVASTLIRAGLPLPTRLWRPLWHLTNDGAWDFVGPSGRVGPEDFGPGRKPESLSAIGAKVERIGVGDALRGHWLSASDRSALRDLVLVMLEEGDVNCEAVASVLGGSRVDEAPLAATSRRLSPSQGRLVDLPVRLAVERHAMERVAAHFIADDWLVDDVSATRSHDLLCTRDGARMLVEVKGTTGLGRKVQLTANEVALARSAEETTLAIVSEIELGRLDGKITAEGGELRLIRCWTPALADLHAMAYRYTVPPR